MLEFMFVLAPSTNNNNNINSIYTIWRFTFNSAILPLSFSMLLICKFSCSHIYRHIAKTTAPYH